MRAGVVAVAIGVGAGCFDPTIPLELPCAPSEPACPTGQVCDPVRQVCVAAIVVDAPVEPTSDGAVPPDAPLVDARPADARRCPADYDVLAMTLPHRYKSVPMAVPWPVARDGCAADGTYLAVPDSADEAVALAVYDRTWIGITDVSIEGVWRTVTGVPAPYVNWAMGEPDNDITEEPTGQDCGVVYGAAVDLGHFDDSYCTDVRLHPYVCECEP